MYCSVGRFALIIIPTSLVPARYAYRDMLPGRKWKPTIWRFMCFRGCFSRWRSPPHKRRRLQRVDHRIVRFVAKPAAVICALALPFASGDYTKVPSSKKLVECCAQRHQFVFVDTDRNEAVVSQKVSQKTKARIHHTKPFIMARQIFSFFSNDPAQPGPHLRAVYIVIVNPPLISRIIRRVNVYAFYLPAIIGQQGLQRVQIVTLHQQVSGLGITGRQFPVTMDQPIGHVPVMMFDSLFPDPVQRWHDPPLYSLVTILTHTPGIPRRLWGH